MTHIIYEILVCWAVCCRCWAPQSQRVFPKYEHTASETQTHRQYLHSQLLGCSVASQPGGGHMREKKQQKRNK